MAVSHTNDEALVTACLQGDRDAFAQIVSRYQSLVCAVAYGVTGNVSQSEDVAQEAFLAAWRNLSQLRDPSKLAPWLSGIARNLAHDAVRRRMHDLSSAASLLDPNAAPASHERPAPDRIDAEEREALVWAALEDIPETYREPLILYYREGESLRSVADLLDLTEDAAKQRLSRGRKMLKEQVTAMVEDTLRTTRPSSTFTAVVVAAISGTAAKASAGVVATEGVGIAAGVTAGKGIATAAGAGLAGGALGAVGGMAGGFLGTWASIKNAHTLRLRRYMLKTTAWWYGLIWLFLGYQGLCGVLLWRHKEWMNLACGIGWALYTPALLLGIVVCNRRYRQIELQDSGARPAPEEDIELSPLALRRVYAAGLGGLVLALLGSGATVLWIHSMPWTRNATLWTAVLLAVSHLVFARLYLWGLKTSPAASAPVASAGTSQVPPDDAVWTRKRVNGAIGGLAGGVYGSTLWMVGVAALGGFYFDAMSVIVLVTLLFLWAARRIRRHPKKLYLTSGWTCILQGIGGALFLLLRAPAWNAAAGNRMPDPELWRTCVLFLVLSFALGASFVTIHVRQSKDERDE